MNSAQTKFVPRSKGLVEEYFPRAWPFIKLMRLNNQSVNILIIFWPFTWGFLLAANSNTTTPAETAFYFALYFLNTIIWMGASCVVNDMWDKDIDSKVERCKNRPIASGEVSILQAAFFYPALMAVCVLLMLPMNEFCQKVFLFNLIPVTLYPASKRIIPCPSVAYGVIANWGALVGWSAVTKDLDVTVCGPLFIGAICWTVVYDTIYGSQDKKDDVQAGIYSTALTLGSNVRMLMTLAGLGAISGLTIAGITADMEWPYYVGIMVASLHLGNQIFTVNLDNPSDCGKKYSDNAMFGFLVFLAILAGSWGLFQRSMATMPSWHEL